MNDVRHRIVESNGIRLHVAEAGSGPVVLLIHGFPESWYSWRYQLPALAAAGYRAVALDVRGYGRSSKPTTVPDYRMVKKVGDVVGLVADLGAPVTIVGHDWGAPIAWMSALLRPDLFRGVAGLSVPYAPPAAPTGPRPTERMRAMAGEENEFYVEYFQQPGRAEAEIEANVREWLLGFYWCASGDVRNGPNISLVPRGTKLRDKFVYPETMPHWLSKADLDVYTQRVRVLGLLRAAVAVSQRRPRLGRSGRLRQQADHDSVIVRRRFARRSDHLGRAGDRTLPGNAAETLQERDHRRRRSLDSAGSCAAHQRTADRVPAHASLAGVENGLLVRSRRLGPHFADPALGLRALAKHLEQVDRAHLQHLVHPG